MDSINPSQCNALNVSDEKQCLETATSGNGLFCSFHSKQAQGLYRGYKRRNAELDKVEGNLPEYLANTKVPLSNQTFADVDKKEICIEIHSHLLTKFQLLDRVIKARKLHHSRFFSMNYDYGHAKFLDALQGQKATVQKAMERLERRTAEVLYENQKWFHWVRECQDEEEKSRDKEQKKIKLEAAMFRRNKSMMETRIKERKDKENKKRADVFLENLYKERMRERYENDELDTDGETDWDPIEGVLGDTRGAFLDLIHHFLWMPAPVAPITPTKEKARTNSETPVEVSIRVPNHQAAEEADTKESVPTESSPTEEGTLAKKSKSKKKKKKKPLTVDNTSSEVPSASSERPKLKEAPKQEQQDLPDKTLIETKDEMANRLKEGALFDTSSGMAVFLGSKDGDHTRITKTPTFSDDEIEPLLGQVSEIKNLLFCRLLLGHATLLPAALRAGTVEEFLADEDVTAAALRDICLKMENPGLQEIRDACADFFRSDEEPDDETTSASKAKFKEDEDEDEIDKLIMKPKKKHGDLPDKWVSKREKAKAQFGAAPQNINDLFSGVGTAVDFGDRNDQPSSGRKVRVKICGRSIWNYPSNQAMTRGGWLQFSIIAKDSSLFDAVSLCRHWDELFELNTLLLWKYFPAPKWLNWVETPSRQIMLQMGFIIYAASEYPDAMELSKDVRNGGRGLVRRSHAVSEYRNFICAHIKRDDQVSRRLVQYLSMQSHCLLVLVRDAETGKLLITPPEAERWLMREKSGLGRAAKNEWNVHKSIGPTFFDEVDRKRKWSFSFKEYYDVYIWDLYPGYSFPSLYNVLQECLYKAHRFTGPNEIFDPAAHILRTICREKGTNRNRDIKPGETCKSILDELKAGGISFHYGEAKDFIFRPETQSRTVWPRTLFYSQTDILEDQILFPEEHAHGKFDPMNIGKISPLRVWETEGFSLKKFVEQWDSDSTDNQDSPDETEDEDWEDDSDSESAAASEKDEDFDLAKVINSLGISPEQMAMGAKKLSDRMGLGRSNDEKMKDDFLRYLDKAKSRIFKEVWHKADLAPNAQSKYLEMMQMYKAALKYMRRATNDPTLDLMRLESVMELNLEDEKDLRKSYAKITPYFHPEFFTSKYGEAYKGSLLFKQEERAKNFVPSRSHYGNENRGKEFWKHLDDCKMKDEDDLEALPEEWDVAVRPIIAQLYKSGILRNRPDHYHEGQAIACKEPQRPNEYDLFIDYRAQIGNAKFPAGLEDPHSVAPLLATAQKFAAKHPTAKFSVLTLWSAPHFYPLMIGPDNHDSTSFRDLIGRRWIWMFVPKDLSHSEWSIHNSAKARIAPYKKVFKDKVVVKRDKYLVMGVNERDCEMLTVAAVQAIQMRPWRWEVDLWKSFVNVDGAFLNALEGVWWE